MPNKNIIEAKNLIFTYSDAPDALSGKVTAAVKGISIDIERGSFVAIIGHNGSGKSTLAKLLSGILLPNGGSVQVYKQDSEAPLDCANEEHNFDIRSTVGMVFQNPDNQLVATIVEDDVAFAPENLGIEPRKIRERVDKALMTVGLSQFASHDTHKLSGGQKQRVAIAGILAMNPECIIFDESTAMLDPQGRRDIMNTILRLRDEGVTVVLITHYMNEAALADKIHVVHEGKIAFSGTPTEVFSDKKMLSACKLEAPQCTLLADELHEFLPKDAPCVINIDLAVNVIEGALEDRAVPKKEYIPHEARKISKTEIENNPHNPILEFENVSYVYGEGTPFRRLALDNISFTIPRGKVTGLIGHTGSGKSTLSLLMNGLISPNHSGRVFLDGADINGKGVSKRGTRFKVGLVFQYPEYQLFEETVEKDIAYGPRNMGLSEEDIKERILYAAHFTGIDEQMLKKSPFELSGGQKRRVAIAGVIAMDPEILVLDEPAAGLDPRGKSEILDGLCDFRKKRDNTLVIISHSMEDIATYCDNIITMSDGKILMEGSPSEVFSCHDMLISNGLAVPEVTEILDRLKKDGYDIDDRFYTVEDAAKEIKKLFNSK